MPNCEQLIIDIQETIRENGNNEITGPVLQDVLIDMVHALCGEQQSFDELTMWSLLSKATPEQINVSHLSATDVAGMLTQAGYKLTDTTYALATDAVAGLLKTGYAARGRNYAVKLDDAGRAYVNVPWTDKFDTYFGVDEDGNIYVKNNRGFWSSSFISARGSDPEAGGGASGVDMDTVWAALAAGTSELINVTHIPDLSISKITGLQDALDSKLEGITKGMVEAVLTGTVTSHNHDGRYAPLSGGLIPSQYLPSYVDDVLEYASMTAFPATGEAGKIYVALDTNLTYRWGGSSYVEISPSLALGHTSSTAYPGDEGAANASAIRALQGYFTNGAANRVAHALTFSYSGGASETYDGSSAVTVTVPTASQMSLWDRICALFDIDADGNVYVKGGRGFYGTSFVSARGSDPGAGSGGGSGVDMESVWYALAQPTSEKINVSHIPALQQLSGTLTNAQLANSSITVAGVKVPLGSAVTTAQIASALTAAGYKLTDTTYTLSSFGITASASELNKLDGLATTATELGYVHGVTSNIQTQLNGKANTSALSAYLPLAGGTMTGEILMTNSKAFVARMATDTSNYRTALGWRSVASGALIAQIGYWNTDYSITLNPCSDEVSEVWVDEVGKYNFVVGKNRLTYNTYPLLYTGNYSTYLDTRYLLKSSYTAADILAKLKTVDGSGSGLDADLLDGYHATSLSRLLSYINSGNKAAAGWYRVFTASSGRTDALGVNIILHLARSFIYEDNEAYTFCISVAYNNQVNITQVSGHANGRLITKIRVVSVPSGALYVDFYLSTTTNGNTYYVSGTGPGTFQEAAAVSTAGGNVTEFTTVNGCKSSGGFSGTLSGNASSATKLATARLLWGRSFDGSGDIRGNIIVGDAIIHGSVTSNNTRFISSDNASNIYFSVGGLVDLVAEPSCLRRGASNTSETLGTSTYRWANVYAVNGDYSGNMTVSGWINNALILSQKGVSADNSDTTTFRINGHILEFGGRGYAHQNYYFRPQYSASGETYADMYIQNASAADSPVFSTMHAFYHNGNAYHYGNLGLGTAAPQAKLDVIGTIRATTGIWSNGYVSAKGQDTTSDARYKRDVAALPAQAALSVLMRLRPATWAWKDDGRRGAGFVAQEVLGVLPEAVREVGDGEDRHLALNYQMLHAYEVSMLQTHETELERLRGRVNQLENEIKRIRYGS